MENIKANELRIGNFIYNVGYLSKVIGFKPFSHSVRCDEEEGCNILIDVYLQDGSVKEGYEIESYLCKPIPLTEEWLLKFGFEKSNVYCFGNRKLIIESLMGDRHSCRYRINLNESIWISELHYVHQLQNLYFALTGEELTFKSE